MTGDAYELKVKHAKTGEWKSVGPGTSWWGFYQIDRTVEADAKFYQALGLETKIRKFQTEYDDRR